MTTTMSVNEGGVVVVDIGGACVDSSQAEDDAGAPKHSLRFAAVPRSLSRNASMQGVVDNTLTVARLPMRRENGRMTVCVSRVRFLIFDSRRGVEGEETGGRTHAPLSVVSEDCVRLTEREELFARFGLFVHVRVELLAQLQKQILGSGSFHTITVTHFATEKGNNKKGFASICFELGRTL